MRWELEEEPPLPRLKWVRKTPVMEGHHGGRETVQICFSFDTKQVSYHGYLGWISIVQPPFSCKTILTLSA